MQTNIDMYVSTKSVHLDCFLLHARIMSIFLIIIILSNGNLINIMLHVKKFKRSLKLHIVTRFHSNTPDIFITEKSVTFEGITKTRGILVI